MGPRPYLPIKSASALRPALISSILGESKRARDDPEPRQAKRPKSQFDGLSTGLNRAVLRDYAHAPEPSARDRSRRALPYFDEWVFRFNRRHSRSRGLLFHTLLRQAVEGRPVTYRSLRKAGRARPAPQPARGSRRHPAQPRRGAARTTLAPLNLGTTSGQGYQDGDPFSTNSQAPSCRRRRATSSA